MIALACGITLKASGKMKWIANVEVHGATPEESTLYSICPIEGDSESDAARYAAKNVAEAIYGPSAEPSFINQVNLFAPAREPHAYMAHVGLYQGKGVTAGRSLRIVIREYRGVY
jgi:hypothetical protein